MTYHEEFRECCKAKSYSNSGMCKKHYDLVLAETNEDPRGVK